MKYCAILRICILPSSTVWQFKKIFNFYWEKVSKFLYVSVKSFCTSIELLLEIRTYHIAEKFGKSSTTHQTKPSSLIVTINNLLADLFICQTIFTKIFIHPLSPNIIIANFSCYTVILCHTKTLYQITDVYMSKGHDLCHSKYGDTGLNSTRATCTG